MYILYLYLYCLKSNLVCVFIVFIMVLLFLEKQLSIKNISSILNYRDVCYLVY